MGSLFYEFSIDYVNLIDGSRNFFGASFSNSPDSILGIMMIMAQTNQKGSMIRTMMKLLEPMLWVRKPKKPVRKPRERPL